MSQNGTTDLLHLRDLGRRGAGLMSIGGAGTFDGIVISGFLAAMLSTCARRVC